MVETVRTAAAKLKVFISYSRRDQVFVDNLAPALGACGFDAFVDREDIAPGEPWEDRLDRLILGADTVVFVMSPASIKSDRCGWEVARTEQRGKRLVPLLLEPVDEGAVPDRLRRLNWIMFNKPELFGTALGQVVEALSIDLEWVREHTRLGEIATRWNERGKAEALLIRGDELLEAERWIAKPAPHGLEATEAHRAFIGASRAAEDMRLNQERAQLAAIAEAQKAREVALAQAEVVQKSRAQLQRSLHRRLGRAGGARAGRCRSWPFSGTGACAKPRDIDEQPCRAGHWGCGLRPSGTTGTAWLAANSTTAVRARERMTVTSRALEARLVNGAMMSQLQFGLSAKSRSHREDGLQPRRPYAAGRSSGTVLCKSCRPIPAGRSRCIQQHAVRVSKAVFSPDGEKIVLIGVDGTAAVWDLLKETELLPFAKEMRVNGASFSSDDKLLALALADGTARILGHCEQARASRPSRGTRLK